MFGLSHLTPSKIPACRYSGSVALPNSSTNIQSFQTITWQDPGYQLEPSKSRIRISTPGRYKLTGMASSVANVNFNIYQYQFWVNGVQARILSVTPHNHYNFRVSFTAYLEMKANDFVEVYMGQYSGGTQTINYDLTILKIG
jgi:hypothetical protein